MTEERDSAPSSAEPIDAAFEPAAAPAKNASRSGPGWTALIGASVVAATAGGIGGSLAAGRGGEDLSQPLEAARGEIAAADAKLQELESALAEAETRLDLEIQSLTAASGDAESLDAVREQISSLAERIEGAPDEDTLSALAARIEAIETADLSDEASSPRLMNRAVTALSGRVDAIEAQDEETAAALQTRAEALAALTTRLAEAEADAARLAAEVEALKTAPPPAAPAQETPAEAAPTTEIEASPAETQPDPAEDVAFALSSIEALSLRGRPFPAAYAKLRDAYPNEPAVAALEDASVNGAPTLAELRGQFDAAAASATEAEQAAAQADGWGWVRRAFGEAVSVRRADAEDEAALAAINAARAALDDDDLPGAVAALDALDAPASEAFDAWRVEAAKRAMLDDALTALNARLTER
ncbi:MAG: hypothetical protein AAFX03_12990 [Pseudomonadota bacterium]